MATSILPSTETKVNRAKSLRAARYFLIEHCTKCKKIESNSLLRTFSVERMALKGCSWGTFPRTGRFASVLALVISQCTSRTRSFSLEMGDLSQVPPPSEHLAILKEEQRLQDAFRILSLDSMPSDHSDRAAALEITKEPSVQLESLFSPDGSARFNIEKETSEEKRLSHLLCSKRATVAEDGPPSPATVSKTEFSARFAEATHGLLQGTSWKGLFSCF